MLGYFLLNDAIVASKTLKRSPERSQIVISPACVVLLETVAGAELPHAASSDVPPAARRVLAAVLFRKERRENVFWPVDSSDDGAGVVGWFAGVDIRVFSFPRWKINSNASDGDEIKRLEKRTKTSSLIKIKDELVCTAGRSMEKPQHGSRMPVCFGVSTEIERLSPKNGNSPHLTLMVLPLTTDDTIYLVQR